MSDATIALIITTLGGIVSLFLTLIFRRLGSVAEKVDGRFTALEETVKMYQDEIVRLQTPGATTPYGEATPEQKVKLTDGVPTALETPKP